MSALKMGVALPYLGAGSVARLAQAAEEAGWDGVFVGDAIWLEDPMIGLTAAAMVTRRIRLGTMITPVPLRKPWKIASESLALDRLSDGRLTLGLGAGAVWMGWQAFPDEPTGKATRAGMLEETIDLLTLFYKREPFDYDGQHYHVKLTQLDVQYYPPKPIQQPRIPLWVVGIWPRMKSMQRALKCDGLLPQVMSSDGQFQPVQPADVREMKAYLDEHRTATTPYDICVEDSLRDRSPGEARDRLAEWAEAGATWNTEGLWEYSEEEALRIIEKGPT